MKNYLLLLFVVLFCQCARPKKPAVLSEQKVPFFWENAIVYFLLTDRFYNGNKGNDIHFGRTASTAKLRGFMGGDLSGIAQKIEEGYFGKLGVNAIWFTPVVEQIHGPTDEGTGLTYGYHGYWAKDWTALDPNFGTEADLARLVEVAHAHGIRVLLDVVINHTGPVTPQDPVWPDEWVRTSPNCIYQDYRTTVECTLVKNLPDIRTESNESVGLPPFLMEKWHREGRLEKEMAELDAFFLRTGYPRAPRFYIIKWLTDFIRKFGVDGFRCDTAKHVEESVWSELRKEADRAFEEWKKNNPAKVLDDTPFYMTGEVYGYGISGGRGYHFGDRQVDFFNFGLNSLINFEFVADARKDFETLFSKYDRQLAGPLRGHGVLNYLSSHDDANPFDKQRLKPLEAAEKLLLCPGTVQIYYGDESARLLDIPGTQGDATLRSFMNWDELEENTRRNGYSVQEVLAHWRKIGNFRRHHPAVGAGRHERISTQPYLFKRTFLSGNFRDVVVVGLGLKEGLKEIPVQGIFPEGSRVKDYYTETLHQVRNGRLQIDSPHRLVLLGRSEN